jgi:hypothetical protein
VAPEAREGVRKGRRDGGGGGGTKKGGGGGGGGAGGAGGGGRTIRELGDMAIFVANQ